MTRYKQITNICEEKYFDNSELLGGKGAGLKNMAKLGIPVPEGFILTTKAWKDYYLHDAIPKEMVIEIREQTIKIEKSMKSSFGATESNRPLLFSVRSGAKFSMPGMMDTILNVGVTKNSIPILAYYFNDEVLAYDIYRRFVKLFASCVYDIHQGEFDLIDDSIDINGEFTLEQQIKMIELYEQFLLKQTGKSIPQNPYEQLDLAIKAVFDSWQNPSAIAYRKINGIPDDLGTAVVVQAMVFGNMKNSCTGVLFSRDTESGKDVITGNYMLKAQGEDIVRGASSRKASEISNLCAYFPEATKELYKYAKMLENYYKDAQDIEFTIENGKVWLLQTRSAKRSPLANIRIAKELLESHVIDEGVALSRIKPSDIDSLRQASFDSESEKSCANNIIGHGETASAGIAVGVVSLTVEDVMKNYDKKIDTILICDHIDPNDISTLVKVAGVITTKGSSSSHMAIIMRSLGLPGIVGCKDFELFADKIVCKGNKTILNGDLISLDSSKGIVYIGQVKKGELKEIPSDLKAINKRKEEIYGKSTWSAAQYAHSYKVDLQVLKTRVSHLLKDSKKKWKSQKAQVAEILNGVFSDKQMHSSLVFSPKDIDGIKDAMKTTIDLGYANAPRTSHYPEKLAGAPWADGPNKYEHIDSFFTNPDFPGKYGGYPRWVADDTLDAMIISREPKGKMNPELAKKHFACTLTCVSTNPANLVLNIVLGTPHLRSLERVESANLIITKIAVNSNFPYDLGHKTYLFGEQMFDEGKLVSLLRKIKELSKNPKLPHRNRKVVHLMRQIHIIFPEVDFANIDVIKLRKYLSEVMVRNAFQSDLYELVVTKTLLGILDQITNKIFSEMWRPPLALPYVMSALDDVVGLSVLEMQGRIDGNRLSWLKIYGAKGAEEKEKIEMWRLNN